MSTKNTETASLASVAPQRLVRLCRFCAQRLDLWMEWKSNHCLYDHATSMPCDECDGANLRNPEAAFTVKLLLPNVKDQAPAERRLPASACSTRCCEVCREPFSELSEELQGELRELFESVKTCAKCCQQKLQEAYERTMVD